MRIGILTSHPIQYQAPLFRALAKEVDLTVYFAHRQTAEGQARAGYGVAFEWDIDLLSGYSSQYLHNQAKDPNVFSFGGCDTPEIAGIIRNGTFDAFIVTGWYLKCCWQAIRACRRHEVPVLVRGDSQLSTQRSFLKRVIKELVYRWVMNQFDGFLYVGQRNLEYLLHYGAPRERCFYVPHFVDNVRFREMAAMSPAQREEVRASLEVVPGEALLLSVGRLVEMKRPLDLLQAARLLLTNGTPVRVIFVGSGPLESHIRTMAQSLNVPVSLPGFKNQTELPRIYAAADLFVLSSCNETWGLVVNEAMACGTPAVVSDAAGCMPDLIDEGATGRSYPMGNIPALAAAIRDMLPRCVTAETAKALTDKLDIYSVERAAAEIVGAVQNLRTTAGAH